MLIIGFIAYQVTANASAQAAADNAHFWPGPGLGGDYCSPSVTHSALRAYSETSLHRS